MVALLIGALLKEAILMLDDEVPVPIEGVLLKETELSRVTRNMTVNGTVFNNSGNRIRNVKVKIELQQDGKLLFECASELRTLPGPGKSGAFAADCYGVETKDIPQGATHKISVLSALRRD